MSFGEAVRKRINEIIEEKETNISDLSLNSLMSTSTLYDFMSGRTKNLDSFTIKKICFGAGITLSEFFNRDYFNNFDDVVK